MKNEQTSLEKFLREKGALTRFKKNIKKSGNLLTPEGYIDLHGEDYKAIIKAFSWDGEERPYWGDLDQQFKDRMQTD